MIREDTLKEYPELEVSINKLSNYLSDEIMQELNYQVDEEGKEPEDVAKDFLKSIGLI